MFSIAGKLGNGDYDKIKGYSLEDINSAFDKIKKRYCQGKYYV
ncbi:hypothetical protein SAMN04489761_2831 [Tenacibaculum sp. MAR_2009_124]|nr:hypothetical protein [Tenacibaculum sp. MAR_2009_124]SEC38004.1 hypothetical protein SAMN04489761_2831 [Tenacibaculum sp. MAR_2009_124]